MCIQVLTELSQNGRCRSLHLKAADYISTQQRTFIPYSVIQLVLLINKDFKRTKMP